MIKMGRSPSKGKLIWGLVGGMTRGDSGKAYCRCRPLLASCVWSETALKHSILHVFLVFNPLFFFVVTIKKNTNKINTCIDWMMSIFCCSHVKEKIFLRVLLLLESFQHNLISDHFIIFLVAGHGRPLCRSWYLCHFTSEKTSWNR